MVIAHLGHPREADVVTLVRKAPNVYADVLACHYRPYRFWQALLSVYGYGSRTRFCWTPTPQRHG